MEPYQVQLFSMSMFLVGCMLVGTAPSAWALRNTHSWSIVIGSFVVSIGLIFVVMYASYTQNAILVGGASLLFGGSVGATLGSFAVAVTHGRRRGAEAVALTLGIVALSTMAAAVIGMLSGFNFQGIGGVMFTLLLFLLGISILMIFVRLGKIWELIIGSAASVFWFVYLIYDFNKVVHKYTEATWPAAAEIAMNIYLDMVNLFIRLLPIIVELLDAMD